MADTNKVLTDNGVIEIPFELVENQNTDHASNYIFSKRKKSETSVDRQMDQSISFAESQPDDIGTLVSEFSALDPDRNFEPMALDIIAHESRNGKLSQNIGQVEEATADDLIRRRGKELAQYFNEDGTYDLNDRKTNIAFISAKLKDDPEPIGKTSLDRAFRWKNQYNTNPEISVKSFLESQRLANRLDADGIGYLNAIKDKTNVTSIQHALMSGGIELVIDGKYGPGTENGIRAYQKKVGLPVSGRLTTETLESLSNSPIARGLLYDNYDVEALAKMSSEAKFSAYVDLYNRQYNLPRSRAELDLDNILADDANELPNPYIDFKSDGFINDYLNSLFSGLASMNASAARSPALAYDVVQLPTNLAYKHIFNRPYWQQKSPEWMLNNPIAKFYDNQAIAFSYTARRWPGETFEDIIARKDPVEISSYISHQVIANAPQQIAILTAMISGFGEATIMGMGALSAAGELGEARQVSSDASATTLDAVINGMAEASFETLGTFHVFAKWNKILLKSIGKNTMRKVLADVFKLILYSGGVEGMEEFGTSISQDVSRHITGIEPIEAKKMFTKALESLLVGGISGMFMTAPTTVGTAAKGIKIKQKRNHLAKAIKEVRKEMKKRGLEETMKEEILNQINASLLANKEITFDTTQENEAEAKINNLVNQIETEQKKLSGAFATLKEGSSEKDALVENIKIYKDRINEMREAIEEQKAVWYEPDKQLPNETVEQYAARMKKAKPPESFTEVELPWQRERDIGEFHNNLEAVKLQEQIKKNLPKKTKAEDMDAAIHRYVDLKNDPSILDRRVKDVIKEALTEEQYNDYPDITIFEALSPQEQVWYDMAQNLTPEQQTIADRIAESYQEIGEQAKEARIFKDLIQNYVKRNYKMENLEKFIPKAKNFSKRALKRTYNTYAEAHVNGFVLDRNGATTNLQSYRNEMTALVADRSFRRDLAKLHGGNFFSAKQRKGYKQLDAPLFKSYEGHQLYAPEAEAKILNNMFNDSALKGKSYLMDVATKYNAVLKAWKLTSSLFHHVAFFNSYVFGVHGKPIQDWNPFRAYKEGLEAIHEAAPIIQHGIANGLTIGLIQDWQEHLLRQKTGFGKVLDKIGPLGKTKDALVKLREDYTNFLFQKWGAGLKAKAFAIEYKNHMTKNPNSDANVSAALVAKRINDDFGGLHYRRLHRNPTVQHLLRFAILGPDWTESNVRLMVKAFEKGPEGAYYRDFWKGAMIKWGIALVLGDMFTAMIAEDDKKRQGLLNNLVDNLAQQWNAGKLNILRVRLNPILERLGVNPKDEYYINPVGHFLDPVKWLTRDIKKGEPLYKAAGQLVNPERLFTGLVKSAYYKASPILQGITNLVLDTDYTFYRKYTTLNELIESGKTRRWRTWKEGKEKVVGPAQFPSYLLAESQRIVPIPIMNLFNYLIGEIEAVEAVLSSGGLDVKRGYEKKKKKQNKVFTGRPKP